MPVSTHTPVDLDAARTRFARDSGFYVQLQQRVAAYFERTGCSRRGGLAMHLKTVVVMLAFICTYLALVFFTLAWWQALPLAVLLGAITAGIGFNIQHDGGHRSYSSSAWGNRLAAMSLDLIGGSSFLWRHKHGVMHHTYTNISGMDSDIDVGIVPRLAPTQPRSRLHRWQHIYIWPLYGLMAIRWQLYSDFRELADGRIGGHPFPRPQTWEVLWFFLGKLGFLTIAFVVPLCFHPVWTVLLFYVVAAFTLGLLLSVVFQLAHCTGRVEFPVPHGGVLDHGWAEHQLRTTANFPGRGWMTTWFLGGLDYQIEHHLFPNICHVHYPALAPIVKATCEEHGIAYRQHANFFSGLWAHACWMRRLGLPTHQV